LLLLPYCYIILFIAGDAPPEKLAHPRQSANVCPVGQTSYVGLFRGANVRFFWLLPVYRPKITNAAKQQRPIASKMPILSNGRLSGQKHHLTMELSKQIRVLKLYVAILTVIAAACLIALILLLRGNRQTVEPGTGHIKVDEITTHRINIVEPDGRLALVISDHSRQHPGRMNGKDFPARDRPAGMIFFNEEGDECGGMVYDGTKKEASFTISVDQYKNDQIMQLSYEQDSAATLSRSYGLRLWDRNDHFTLQQRFDFYNALPPHDSVALRTGLDSLRKLGYLSVERLFLGHTADGQTGLFLRDNKGIPRLRICIGKENQPLIQTLDEQGRVVGTASFRAPAQKKAPTDKSGAF
jgi:hypothetical protein